MSLYRKYRPQTFEDVVGQEHVARTLRNALTANPPRVAHAYLFTGPRGIGKTTNARLLAKCLNCSQGPTPRPCNQCDFCVRVAQNQPVMDLVEIDAASNTGVGDVRETIIEKVNMAPAEGRYRIYIIDEVHMLSNSAFNALLKTLEEPPAHAIFVLATTETHKVPATILSRCQRFDFRRVTPPDIAKRLQYVAKCENIQLHEEAARLIARHADGALRDALTLLEQVIAFSGETVEPADVRLVLGGVPQELLYGLVQSVAEGDARGVLEIIEQAVNEGASFSQMARDLSSYARDLLLVTVGFDPDETLSAEEKQLRTSHAQALGRARIEALLSALRDTEKEMKTANDHRLLLELTLIRASEGLLPLSQATQPAATAPRPVASWREKLAPAQPKEPPAAETPKAEPPQVVTPPVREIKVALPPVEEPPIEAVEETDVPEVAYSNGVHSNGVAPVPTEPEITEIPTAPEDEYADYAEDAHQAEVRTEEYNQQPPVVAEEHGTEAPPVQEQEVVHASEIEATTTEAPAEAVHEAPSTKKKGRRISNFDELVELWPKLLIRIRTKIGVTAVAYLHDARPVGFTNDEIVLEFTKEFHYAKATEASGRLPFEDKINEVLDKPRHLRFQMAAPVVKAPEPVVEETSNDDDDEDDLYGGDIVEYTQTVFAADIMGRSG